jgi:hypothetical protein
MNADFLSPVAFSANYLWPTATLTLACNKATLQMRLK